MFQKIKNKKLYFIIFSSAFIFIIFLYFSLNSKAAAGDFAIYREAAGLELVDVASPTDQTWDTIVSEGAIFNLDDTGGSPTYSLVNLSDAGHYFVMYNIGLETDAGTNRSEIQGWLNLAGTSLAYGRSSCYIRRSGGADECWISGSAIINAAAGDDIKVSAQRTDNNSATVRRRANNSGFMLLKLNDNWNYARLKDATGGQAFNSTTFSTVSWDTNDELDAGFSRTGGDITLSEAGHYLVTTNVMFRNSSGSARRNNEIRLTLDGYEIPGTRTSAYLRGSNSTQDHAAVWTGIIEATTTNQTLNIQAACEGEACGGVTNVGNQTALAIVKIPDSAEYISLTETVGGQLVDGTNDPVLWDKNKEVDSASFSHSTTTNSSRININKNGNYLFFSSFYSNRSPPTGTERLYPHWEWQKNGSTKYQYGSFGKYNRGDQSTTGTFSAGDSGGILLDNMTSSDYIEILNTDETTGTDSLASFQPSRMSVQGVNIASLFIDVSVTSSGSQIATSSIPATNKYIGGKFVIKDVSGSRNVTGITITENGTVDAQNNLNNIKLFYDLDTTAPYDCASESYSGTESQFGLTDTNGFSSANGTASFTGTQAISTTQSMCVYVVLDIGSGANNGDTLDIEISDPSTQVAVSSGSVSPDTAVVFSGSTILQDDVLTQIHYQWRNDDGSETTATSATGGTEDTAIPALLQDSPRRLRLEVSNEGSASSTAIQYRLEYGQKSTTCSAIGTWTDVGAAGGDWDMSDSLNLTDGNNTTNITVSSGGTTDENTTFKTPNAAIKDTSSQTAGITLLSSEFVELEYSIVASTTAPEGNSYCFRVTDAGTALASYSQYPEVTISADVSVDTNGTQTATMAVPSTGQYVGGMFVISENTGSRNVTGITITENGTVDAQNNLNNIKLFYDLDTTAPYDCASESYSGTETQFGLTDTNGFSSANGTSTFSGSVNITTTQSMCVYAVLDVGSGANTDDTLELEISNPSTEITVDGGGSVAPSAPVAISGSTSLQGPVLTQIHYQWRNDDGSETTATSATGGTEDTALNDIFKNTTLRLRLEVSNEGLGPSASNQYRLEYGQKSTTCSAIGTWTDVGAAGGDWDMSDSLNLTDGNNTTNIAVSSGGTTDENTTFKTPNAAIKDTSSQTAGITLLSSEFVELEYSIEATDNAAYGSNYCFRLTNAGSAINSYNIYPEVSVRDQKDFYIQRGVTTISGLSATITAGVDYVAPTASTSAFIRITNTQHTGAGRDVGGGNQNADNVTVYISDASNIKNSVTFSRFGSADNTRVAWEIVEYIGPSGGDNEIIVRAQEPVTFGSASLYASSTVSGVVNGNDLVIFTTGMANPDNSLSDYNTSLATAKWSASTNEAVFERGESGGDASVVSFAAVEFTGSNWNIQRVEHTYTQDVSTETEAINSLNSLSRAFLHVQKRTGTGEQGLDEFGHEVWLSGVGEVSFQLQSGVSTPSLHTSVAWVIENTQTNGVPMVVTRSNGTQSGGVEPLTVNISIGKTLSDISTASIFINNRVTGTGTAYPRPIMAARIVSASQYELWISDTGQTQTYRTEIVEWPTAVRTLAQNYYRFYVNNDTLDPTDAWPVGASDLGENTSITALDGPPVNGSVLRIRMSVLVSGANLSASSTNFKLQYGERSSTCSAISSWSDLGAVSSTTALWRGYNNVTPSDGVSLSGNPPTSGNLNLSVSDRAGTYEEENNSTGNPYKVFIGEDVEYDWVIEDNLATDLTSYCFRMVKSDGTELDNYNYYPTLITGGYTPESSNWRWYDDENNITPTSPLAAENSAPSNVANGNIMKLRFTINETAGKQGDNVKFKIQFSESSTFSSGVYDIANSGPCSVSDVWCYADGAGVENVKIASSTLSDADSCVGGVGAGCGTHNEYSFVPKIIGETGTLTASTTATVVNLKNTYTNPVFIVESISGDSTNPTGNRPAAAMITATTSSSFTVRIQEPDNESDNHGDETVSYIVMEKGAWTLDDGTKIDVGTIDTSSYYGNGVSGDSDDTCSFTQNFSGVPVVLSAIQTNNNTSTPDFLTVSQHTIGTSGFSCAIEVPDGETNIPTQAETIGWIAIDQGVTTVNGITIDAGVTSVSVQGTTDTPWYQEAFTASFSNTPYIVANKQTRNGGDGGWIRYEGLTSTSTFFSNEERDDGERSHTGSESVGYFAFSKSGDILIQDTSAYNFPSNSAVEFEFTIKNIGARANTVYFFRAFDLSTNTAVPLGSGKNYPSLSTEGALLTFSIDGLPASTVTEGVTTDVDTTSTAIPFGSLPIASQVEAAQRLNITTNATGGYKIFVFQRQGLALPGGLIQIDPVTGTNASPLGWSSGCSIGASGCYGYHAGDDYLAGGSTRFFADDTYAQFDSSSREVAYNSDPVPNGESIDMVYKTEIQNTQESGNYDSSIVYIAVVTF